MLQTSKYLIAIIHLILFIAFLNSINLFLQNQNIDILKSINSSNKFKSDKYCQFIPNSTGAINIGTPLTLAIIVRLAENNRETFKNACLTGAASLFCSEKNFSLKFIVNRKRPFETYSSIITKKSCGGDLSFPSKHTSSALHFQLQLYLA